MSSGNKISTSATAKVESFAEGIVGAIRYPTYERRTEKLKHGQCDQEGSVNKKHACDNGFYGIAPPDGISTFG
jgi:hypothetical protein